MSRLLAKGLIIGGCMAAGFGVIALGRPVPTRPVSDVLVEAVPPAPSIVQVTDSIRSGEGPLAVLTRHGLETADAHRAVGALSLLDPKKLPVMPVLAEVHPDSGVVSLAFQVTFDRLVKLVRQGGEWIEQEERLPWTMDTIALAGVVASSLTEAIVSGDGELPGSARLEVAYSVADVLEYRVDLSRDLRVGDSVTVLVEREQAPGGHVRTGRILATRASIGGTSIEAVRFEDATGKSKFFDAEGKSLEAAFLQAPLQFSRISSVYGGRRHPILKTWRQHTGVDYAASTGTPVRAVGNGTVIFAGWKGGYGRTVEIRHSKGMVTRYGHLNSIASGIRAGVPVSISKTIGSVGMTGLATGPHLHFETLVNGVHRDPRKTLRNAGGAEPLPVADRVAFQRRRSALFADLNTRVYAMQNAKLGNVAQRIGGGQNAARAAGAAD